MKTARRLALTTLALAASMLASGCIIDTTDDGGGTTVINHSSADLDFTWTCSGARCADVGVQSTVVELTGPERINLEVGTSGVSLQYHAPGVYDFHIVGLSPSRVVLYEAYGTVSAYSGSNYFPITLVTPYVPVTATLNFSWDCDGAVCPDVGVASTVVELDGARTTSQETAANGMSLSDLPLGTYSFHIAGLSPSRVVLYEAFGTIAAAAGDNYVTAHLARP